MTTKSFYVDNALNRRLQRVGKQHQKSKSNKKHKSTSSKYKQFGGVVDSQWDELQKCNICPISTSCIPDKYLYDIPNKHAYDARHLYKWVKQNPHNPINPTTRTRFSDADIEQIRQKSITKCEGLCTRRYGNDDDKCAPKNGFINGDPNIDYSMFETPGMPFNRDMVDPESTRVSKFVENFQTLIEEYNQLVENHDAFPNSNRNQYYSMPISFFMNNIAPINVITHSHETVGALLARIWYVHLNNLYESCEIDYVETCRVIIGKIKVNHNETIGEIVNKITLHDGARHTTPKSVKDFLTTADIKAVVIVQRPYTINFDDIANSGPYQKGIVDDNSNSKWQLQIKSSVLQTWK
jgi:hypothetical protein